MLRKKKEREKGEKKRKAEGLCFIVASVGKTEMLLPQHKIDSFFKFEKCRLLLTFYM